MNGFKFEKALRLLYKYYPKDDQKKPSLYHSVRVGVYLWNNGYNENLQIAGLLHDALEDTDMPENDISSFFGDNTLNIVKANSKNNNLEKSETLEDIVKRCSIVGKDAMIVKLADVYDNFLFYVKVNNVPEIERCKTLANLVKKYKDNKWNDKIFLKIDEIIKYKKNR